ncbi:MAG: nucleoid occlusion factor SlmA [Pseudomonadota bacterium]|nr:nucleoid occlusion factor SlmA [Pseudomonadales bacterium]MDY6921432.1 nucleoid occlusion factor SlmA [Pseudomonadota bacterium]
MTVSERKVSRKEQILQALAHMLEASPGGRITTAALAKEVGVSEAALYRHFPSKAKMFEGLIEFIENSLFSRINLILKEEPDSALQCGQILHLLLGFAEKNPGITRILTGDAITGETDRLRQRVVQLFDRIETQLKQILREAELKEGRRTRLTATQAANMILALAEGRICQYVRSGFTRPPLAGWDEQWQLLAESLYRTP